MKERRPEEAGAAQASNDPLTSRGEAGEAWAAAPVPSDSIRNLDAAVGARRHL